ncbi:uncharacterized protein LOC143284087 isoform X2 [Babylonia areolata]
MASSTSSEMTPQPPAGGDQSGSSPGPSGEAVPEGRRSQPRGPGRWAGRWWGSAPHVSDVNDAEGAQKPPAEGDAAATEGGEKKGFPHRGWGRGGGRWFFWHPEMGAGPEEPSGEIKPGEEPSGGFPGGGYPPFFYGGFRGADYCYPPFYGGYPPFFRGGGYHPSFRGSGDYPPFQEGECPSFHGGYRGEYPHPREGCYPFGGGYPPFRGGFGFGYPPFRGGAGGDYPPFRGGGDGGDYPSFRGGGDYPPFRGGGGGGDYPPFRGGGGGDYPPFRGGGGDNPPFRGGFGGGYPPFRGGYGPPFHGFRFGGYGGRYFPRGPDSSYLYREFDFYD